MSLYDYYKSIGQNLPSLGERAKAYESMGLGSAGSYVGSATQNSALENSLKSKAVVPVVTPQAKTTPVSTPATNIPSVVPTNTQTTTSSNPNQSLVDVLVQKGGYSRQDAINASNGPRASELAKEFGVNTGTSTPSSITSGQPTLNLQAVYDTAYNTPEIKQAQAELDASQKAYNDATAIIGDNPFYADSSMKGKLDKLDNKFKAEQTRLANKLASLKSDAEIKVNIATKQYDINNQAYQDNLKNFNNLLSAGAFGSASTADLSTYATQLGVPVSMIEDMVKKQKADEIKPQVITSTDDGGNVTAVIIDANTGKLINKTSLGKIDKSKSSSGSTKDEELNANIDNMVIDMKNGVSLRDLINYYGARANIDTQTIYNLYNQYSKNGPATETIDEIKQGMFNDLQGLKSK